VGVDEKPHRIGDALFDLRLIRDIHVDRESFPAS